MRKLIFPLFFLLLLVSCHKPSSDEEFSVIATTFPSYTLAREVLGERGNLKMLLPPGVESHHYDPTPKDMIEIASCDLLIFTGGESDEWIESILESIDREIACFRLVDNSAFLLDESEQEGHQEKDEHVWTSIDNEIELTKNLINTLSYLDSELASEYLKNGNAYILRLETLKKEYQEVIDNRSKDTVVFASRFPFRYLFDEFNLKHYAAFPGCNDETEPSSRVVATLIDKIKELNLKYIFNIEFSSQNLAHVIAEETGAEILTLNSMHNITPESFRKGDDYITIMEDNLALLKKALE